MTQTQSILNLSRDKVKEILYDISSEIYKKYNITVNYINSTIPSGEYNNDFADDKTISAGILGLNAPDIKEFNRQYKEQKLNQEGNQSKKEQFLSRGSQTFSDNVPDLNFTLLITSIFHECQHAHQDLFELQETNKADNEMMAVQMLVIEENSLYYSKNYSNQLVKIDAEYASLKNTKNFLEHYFNLETQQIETLLTNAFKKAEVVYFVESRYNIFDM